MKLSSKKPGPRSPAPLPKQSRAARPGRRPFIFINMAMTADAKIATENRAVSTFGSPADHDHLLELRATADAVMAGARTVDTAPINLGPGPARFRRLRLRRGLAEYPLRVLVSGSGSLDPGAEVFRHGFSPILVLTTGRCGQSQKQALESKGAIVQAFGKRELNWRKALAWLRERWGVRRLLCEGGGDLNDALFGEGLVDEVHLTICPFIFGGGRAPTIAEGVGVDRLELASRFRWRMRRRVGDEFFVVLERVREQGSVSQPSGRKARAGPRGGSGTR
jgi:riboflavin-specific deaminase-like protein